MIVSHNAEVMKAVMKFCQARLSPPLLGQIVAEASIEGTEEYSRQCFEEYLERRNFFIDGLNRIPGVYSPMPKEHSILFCPFRLKMQRTSASGVSQNSATRIQTLLKDSAERLS